MPMHLTEQQQAVLNGSKGEVMAKVMKTLVMYGETFGASRMVPVTSEQGHLVTSFGLSMMKPVYDLMDQLIEGNALSQQKFTMDPRPLDPAVPSNFLQNLIFRFMYSKQADYEKQLKQLGLLSDNAFTCTCYMPEVGNEPKKGDILSWAESSAVVYANSVLGARCNRNSGIIELFGSIAGWVPEFGLLTDEGRKATWVVDVRTTKKPEAQVLGSAIGMKVLEDVPYIRGLDQWIGTDLNDEAKAYLKNMGAATASNGAVGLYHVDKLTPEACEIGESLIADGARSYIIDDAELERVKASYPCIWKDSSATPKLCFIGCPHLSAAQLEQWTDQLQTELKKNGRQKVAIPTVFTAAPAVADAFRLTPRAQELQRMGVVLSSICPLMYMNNPLCGKMPVITNSNKLRTYSTARYYTDDEILAFLSKGGQNA
ncbi:aconitase X [uncultured Ruthenibacterium sp.]|uniref:aconitase X n=1 Tax=uncultured Ruthenibacterium sp. TaxID=1905347 RepID=UPI00349EE1E0